MFNVVIGDNKISIKDRFTLIKGKFKKELLKEIQNANIFENLEDFKLVSLGNFLKIFKKQAEEYHDLDKSLKLLEFLSGYRTITKSNAELIFRYINLIQSLILVLNYNIFLKKKNFLLKELELSKIKKKSSDIAAKTDLLNKLITSINENKKKLNYFEEDFFNIKNQRDQISNTINDYNLKIRDLNNRKKECFSQINKITREMDDSIKDKKDDFNLNIDNENNISISEKIMTLRKQAREFQYEINQIKSKLNETQLKFNEINPKYEQLEKDYQDLVNIIKIDENRVKSLKNELKEKLNENKNVSLKDFDINELNSIKPSQEIENEIQKIDNELTGILESNSLLDNEKPDNLSNIMENLKKIDETLKNNKEDIIIPYNRNEIVESIKNFRSLEALIINLEVLMNNFLSQISLESHFQIIISNDNKNFFIQIQFIRSNKERVNFDDLTTPEKIFFVITQYISIKIILNSKNVIFSNLFLPIQYNKRGSIYRTLRKILPLFENEENLKDYNLIFIISNLEMKKPIEKLKVINI